MTGNWLYTGGQVLCRLFTTSQFDLKVKGVKNIPRTGGVLIASNHQSLLDPVLIGVQVPRPLTYLAKSDLFENPYVNWLIRSLYAFPVRQERGEVSAVREAIRRLEEGRALVVFPEGSRTKDGELLSLEPGIGLIARKADVPIVPCVIHGSFEAWPKGHKLFRPGKIRVHFGQPLFLNHLKASAIVQQVDQTMHRMFDELRSETLSEPRWQS
jgi:1-acyl-sn-glycerol-3-phosphate acyltransferase